MCGIAGIIGSNTDSQKLLNNMLSKISHRGEEKYQKECINLPQYSIGTNRLAIVDEQNGKQPFSWKNKVFCISNGEIYNHKELKIELEKHYNFTSNCDTETIVISYLYWGNEFVEHLDGKFAICIVDTINEKYILARDHIGIKPLYFSKNEKTLFFASELKSFCELSSLKDIHSLQPGHLMINGNIQRYYQVPDYNINDKVTCTTLLDGLSDMIVKAIKKRIHSENDKVACLLSGGIDSSIILYLANQLGAKVQAFTFANTNEYSSDLEAAKKLCKALGIDHIIVSPSKKELQDFYLKYGVYLTESYEPVLVRNAVSYHFVCKEVRRKGYKYLLNGEGADELFGGYDYFKELPQELQDNKIKESLLNLHLSYLQMADRASMYTTIEARVPYLDKELINYSFTLPENYRIRGNIDKWSLRESFKGKLPEYIVNRQKMGMNEGAGFGKNTAEGIYYNAVQDCYNKDSNLFENDLKFCLLHSDKFKINVDNIEEVYNFCRYAEYGFIRLSESNIRLQLNTRLKGSK
jgi:asparagine synthase (glutamine-hydrolysing)